VVLDNLNVHLAPELADFAEENKAWLRVCRLPTYAPDLNPAEGIWSLLKQAMANFAVVITNLSRVMFVIGRLKVAAAALAGKLAPGDRGRRGAGRACPVPTGGRRARAG
jgi:hypothetical protein